MKKLLLTLTFLSVSVSTFANPVSTPRSVQDSPATSSGSSNFINPVSTPNSINDNPIIRSNIRSNVCTMTCPGSGIYSLYTNKCVTKPTFTCSDGMTYNSGTEKCWKYPAYCPDGKCEAEQRSTTIAAGYEFGLIASGDGKKLASVYYSTRSSYVSVDSGGRVPNKIPFEISNGKIRILAYYRGGPGKWVDLNGSGKSDTQVFYEGLEHIEFFLRIEVSDGKIRYCGHGYEFFNLETYYHTSYYDNGRLFKCAKWIYLHPCPTGTTYNSSTNKCEATPTITCPTNYKYNSTIKKCEGKPVMSCKTQSIKIKCEIAPTITCPNGTTYNSSTGKCQANVSITCPSGGSYNSFTKKCEAPELKK